MARFRMLPRTSRIVALCSAANFINAADRVIMPIAIVQMTDEYKWNLHWQGWILSAFAFGYFTSQVTIFNHYLIYMNKLSKFKKFIKPIIDIDFKNKILLTVIIIYR